MEVVVDTNIVLDVLADRQPFVVAAKALWTKVQSGEVQARLVATTFTTVFYVVRKQAGTATARQAVADLLSTFGACPVDSAVLRAAIAKPASDFEDAVLDASAELAGIPVIVTRNTKDFAFSTRRIVDAATLVQELDAAKP